MSTNGRRENPVPEHPERGRSIALSDHARKEILQLLEEEEPAELRKLTDEATEELLKHRGLLGWLGLSTSTG